jgi:hypothetical protein
VLFQLEHPFIFYDVFVERSRAESPSIILMESLEFTFHSSKPGRVRLGLSNSSGNLR